MRVWPGSDSRCCSAERIASAKASGPSVLPTPPGNRASPVRTWLDGSLNEMLPSVCPGVYSTVTA